LSARAGLIGYRRGVVEDSSLLTQRRTGAVLFGAVLATVIIFLLPANGLIGRPLLWLSTLVHELGHGITAWLVGGSFDSFDMWPKGSGLAHCDAPRQYWALVSAGGLVGPAIVAAIGFVLARRARVAQVALLLTAGLLLVLTVLLAGTWLAWMFMPAVAVGLIFVAARKDPEPAQIALVFLSTQMALSVFSRGDYLFTKEATTGAGTFPSDVANMATALGGPFWMWGAIVGLFSVLMLAGGLWLFTRSYPQLRWRQREGVSKLRSR
jgi:hypothetical protein